MREGKHYLDGRRQGADSGYVCAEQVIWRQPNQGRVGASQTTFRPSARVARFRNMWALHNKTPFEADRTWIRDKDGAHHWIVVVKATYDVLLTGGLELSREPLEPLQIPTYIGEDGQSSLEYEADLIPM